MRGKLVVLQDPKMAKSRANFVVVLVVVVVVVVAVVVVVDVVVVGSFAFDDRQEITPPPALHCDAVQS